MGFQGKNDKTKKEDEILYFNKKLKSTLKLEAVRKSQSNMTSIF